MQMTNAIKNIRSTPLTAAEAAKLGPISRVLITPPASAAKDSKTMLVVVGVLAVVLVVVAFRRG